MYRSASTTNRDPCGGASTPTTATTPATSSAGTTAGPGTTTSLPTGPGDLTTTAPPPDSSTSQAHTTGVATSTTTAAVGGGLGAVAATLYPDGRWALRAASRVRRRCVPPACARARAPTRKRNFSF